MEYHKKNRHQYCQKFHSGMLAVSSINEIATDNRQQSIDKESHLYLPQSISTSNKKKKETNLLNNLKTYTDNLKTNKSPVHQKQQSKSDTVSAIWLLNRQHNKFNNAFVFIILASSLLVILLGQISVDCEPQRFQANRPARQIDCQ